MTPALAKELVEALEFAVRDRPTCVLDVGIDGKKRHYRGLSMDDPAYTEAECWVCRARAVLARAKAGAQTGTHEFTVTDDGHGRAMVGGKRLAFGGARLMVGDFFKDFGATKAVGLDVGTRVRVELREGVDFATLLEVVP